MTDGYVKINLHPLKDIYVWEEKLNKKHRLLVISFSWLVSISPASFFWLPSQ